MQHVNLIEAFQRGMQALLRFLGVMGSWIINHPNGILYILIVVGCFFFRYFALLTIISLLAWSWFYGANYAERNY